ncbi:restriction endonuclease subunit S [Weissella soli]|uniref:restriction endonuclease subunit S n=1 Tax=Weissella soli TaxID=155866 RepID=UPI001F1CE7AC|nr:restriction endonuclease subunit S [Weissella soli]GJM47970.1 restriction endonuclease [Weissella soli]
MSNKVPQIRFNGYSDAWVERKFEELLDAKEGVRRGPFGSALKKDLFVDFSDYVVYEQQNAIYDQYETRYNITEEKFNELKKFEILPGDYIMSGAGTIGRISEVPHGIKRGVFNQALIRFRINPEVTNKEYFLTFMRGDIMQRKLTGANPGSAITNLVPMSEVKNYDINIPSIDEQAKIGSLLATLDNLIAANQRKLDLLKEQKKGYLQKMFPKNGAKVPELRFAGFVDDWEERKLGTIYDFGKGKGLPLDSFIYSSNNPAIAYGHLYTKYSEVISEVFWSSNDNGVLSKDNDLLFPGSSTVPNGTAQANAITLNNVKLGGDIIIGRPKEGVGVLSTFMSYQVNSQRQKLFPIIVGTTITHMYGKDISKLNFFITDYSEQEKIASFFKQLDDTIALHQSKLDLLKKQKKGYLQKMFV